jgi:CBS domain-containing protein
VSAADRPNSADKATLAPFLGSCPPFDVLESDELRRIVAHAVIEHYHSGAIILDAFDLRVHELFVVWEGRVDIWTQKDRLNELPDKTVGTGEVFGYIAALTGAAFRPQAVAVGKVVVIRLPVELVAPAFASRRGARFLAQEVWSAHQRTVGIPTYTLVDDLIASAPLVISPEASIQEAASRMTAANLGYAAVQVAPGRYGMVTDASIRAIVAAARPTTIPVTEVMNPHPTTVQSGASAAEALIRLLEGGEDFILVMGRTGDLRGAIAPIDFAVSSTTAGAALHEQLRRASTAEELGQRYRQVPHLVSDLLARGLASNRVITVHAALVDTIVRRAIHLVMAAHSELDPEAFTWLALGSYGRGEAVLSSDLDAAVSFTNELTEEEIVRYRPAFIEIADVLAQAGLKQDRHGVSPVNPAFARTHRQWEAAAQTWLSKPTKNDAMIKTCLLVDGRPIHGDPALPEVTRVFSNLRLHPTTMKMLFAISVDRSHASRNRRWHKKIDPKQQVLLPITNIARWAALSMGSSALHTPERLGVAAGSRMVTAEDAAALADVFEIAQHVRLRHQVEQLETGEPLSDTMRVHDMSPIEASVLEEAIREILVIQRRMANKAKYVPDLLDPRLRKP